MKTIEILIVEDEPIIAADLKRQLEKMGYAVLETLESGEEAIEFTRAIKPDLLIMDIQLSGNLDGIDTVNKIGKTHNIPVIFLTSNTDERTFSRARFSQPIAFLSKPFRATDLRHSIELAFFEEPKNTVQESSEEDETPAVRMDDRVFIKSKDYLIKIQFDDLLWIEADGCYCTLKTTEKKHTIVSTLKKFSEKIQHKSFVRVHRSHLINITKVDRMSDSYVYIGEKKIPIGRSYKSVLQQSFRTI